MKHKKKKNFISKFMKDAICITTTVSSIESLNVWTSENKFKTVFFAPSTKTESKERMCIAWERTTIRVGDTVQLTGRLSNEVFLVWNILIMKRHTQDEH
jgi:hypothetical protein